MASLCHSGCFETCYVVKAGLELIEIHLPLCLSCNEICMGECHMAYLVSLRTVSIVSFSHDTVDRWRLPCPHFILELAKQEGAMTFSSRKSTATADSAR